MKSKLTLGRYAIYGLAILGLLLTVNAFAATSVTASDTGTGIIIFASVVGAFSIPLIGAATNPANPFDARQYVLAIVIILPTTLGFTLTALESFVIESISIKTGAMLFITVYLQAMGIEYGKSRTSKALKEGRTQRVTSEDIAVVDTVVL